MNQDVIFLPYRPAIELYIFFISLIFQSLIACSLTELNEHL